MSFSAGQYVFLYCTLLGSMFAGASVVHFVLAPDLRLPVPPALHPIPATSAGEPGSAPHAPPAERTARLR